MLTILVKTVRNEQKVRIIPAPPPMKTGLKLIIRDIPVRKVESGRKSGISACLGDSES